MQALETSIAPELDRRSWYVVQVWAGHEKTVCQLLEFRGYETFLPLRKTICSRFSENSDHWRPLFPGYLFCRLDISDRRVRVISTPWVIRLLGAPARPEPVPNSEIEALQAIVRSSLPSEVGAAFRQGERCRILEGPLQGVEGTIRSVKGRTQLAVEVTILQRSVYVQIPGCSAAPCTESIRSQALKSLARNGEVGVFQVEARSICPAQA